MNAESHSADGNADDNCPSTVRFKSMLGLCYTRDTDAVLPADGMTDPEHVSQQDLIQSESILHRRRYEPETLRNHPQTPWILLRV